MNTVRYGYDYAVPVYVSKLTLGLDGTVTATVYGHRKTVSTVDGGEP
jgi:hypothetical protein